MSWMEFRALLTGIAPDTALGRVVSIRAENDRETLKQFTPEMNRIRNEWRSRMAKKKKADESQAFLASMKDAFMAMAGIKQEKKTVGE